MVVKPEDVGVGEGFGHQDGGSAFPAPNVGHLGTAREFVLDAIESRDPRADQIRGIARTEEFLASMKHTLLVLTPAHPGARTECLCDARDCGQRSQRKFKRSGQISRTIFIRQGERLLFGHPELLSLCVVSDVTARCLRRQPLAYVTLVGTRYGRQLRGCEWAGSQSLVETKAFSDHDHTGVNGSSEIVHKLP